MASNKKYAYYFRGRDIALVENKDNQWQSPTETITNGLMMEYSKMPEIPTNEAADIDVSETLGNALMYYFKAMIAESQNNLEEKEYFYALFIRWADMDRRNKIKAVRRVIPSFSGSPGIKSTS
jgi:hypothetical protein